MRKAMFLFCGLCWFAFGLAVGIFLLGYLTGGAGLQYWGVGFQVPGPGVSSGTVLMGMEQFAGLFVLAGFCLVVGLGLFLHGWELRWREPRQVTPTAGAH